MPAIPHHNKSTIRHFYLLGTPRISRYRSARTTPRTRRGSDGRAPARPSRRRSRRSPTTRTSRAASAARCWTCARTTRRTRSASAASVPAGPWRGRCSASRATPTCSVRLRLLFIYPPPVWNRPILLTRRSLGSIHCPTGRGCGAVAYLSDNHAPNQRELVEADVVRALAAAMQGESVLHEVH